MKKLAIILSSLIINSTFAAIILGEVCGDLAYVNGSYVLYSEHGVDFKVLEKSLESSSMEQTKIMRAIVQNHDYYESDYPKACFYDVEATQIERDEFIVLSVRGVQAQEFLF